MIAHLCGKKNTYVLQNDPLNTEVGMNLKAFLEKNGFKHRWFAERIPCSPGYFSRLTTGISNPSILMVKRIEQLTNGEVTHEDFKQKKTKRRKR